MTSFKNIVVFLLFFMGSYALVWPQASIEFDKDNFPDDQKKQLKQAIKDYKEGDNLFENKPPLYKRALEYFLKANDFNPDNALLNYKIGYCYLKTVLKTHAIPYLEKAVELDANVKPDLYYLLGRAYHLNHEIEKARINYNYYKSMLSPYDLSVHGPDIKKKHEECDNADQLMANPIRVFIDNLGNEINTSYAEYSPIINGDGSLMFFTSSRDNTTGGKKDPLDLLWYEDIYISKHEAGRWISPENPGKPLNTDSHDAIVGISPDGKHALIYKGEDNGGDIYSCRIGEDGQWGRPKSLPKEINTEFHETSACFAPDMSAVYFVSNKEGGYGGSDIYISMVSTKGRNDKLDFEDAVNLGATINSPYDEEGVFMHPDGETLYFSSKGHNTMGGYDIFRSVKENGRWSEPENIAYPVNTADDDVFFSITADKQYAYYSSVMEGGFGDRDLYMITFLGPEKKPLFINEYDHLAYKQLPLKETFVKDVVEIKTYQMVVLKGRIIDQLTLSPIGGVIVEIYDNSENRLIASFESNSRTGSYLVSLMSGKNYGLAIKAKEYLFHSENIIIPPATSIKEIYKDVELKKIAVGTKIVLKNIFFDFNKASLRKESSAELNRLVKLLNDVPTLKIEISGHTDNVGSALYNQELSENRAKTVVEYLIAKGIEEDRLSYKGYGFSQPIATNDTEDGRQMNRRTEFKVISR